MGGDEVKNGVGLCILANLPGAIFVIVLALFLVGVTGKVAPANEIESCTSADIPAGALDNINKNTPIYKKAESETGVPWGMIAGIHFRETNNSRVTPIHNSGDGVYQILSKNYTHPAGQELSDEEFLLETIDAANFLNGKVGNKLTKDTTDIDLIKNAFWKYNGTAYGGANNSPYVMNNFDDAHKNMPIIKEDGGSPTLPGDTRNGAYTTYVILKGNCK